MWHYRVLVQPTEQVQAVLNALDAQDWEVWSIQTLVRGGELVSICLLRKERI